MENQNRQHKRPDNIGERKQRISSENLIGLAFIFGGLAFASSTIAITFGVLNPNSEASSGDTESQRPSLSPAAEFEAGPTPNPTERVSQQSARETGDVRIVFPVVTNLR